MPPLESDTRNQLATTIKTARREGEAGARRALEALAVPNARPHEPMTPEERGLRNRLRARARQLGDMRDTKTSEQSIERLVHEVAYEHWHRMLFARFLAENGLLIEPDSGVAITLDECEELAREQGEDPHEMAARFAQGALPQIFRVGDPVLDLELAPETRQALERLLDNLPREVFTADDSLGWTYQFWQTERKDEVNASGVKIGADELPAVTQLFTEHYMVQFLYHNTIGAWHAGKVLAANPGLAESAKSEEELRRAVRLQAQGGYDFEYLRFVREMREGDEEDTPTGPWRPAAGVFEGWPKTAEEIKVLDPCCGSGHFLVEGFELLVRLRMDEEGLGLEEAIRGVLSENLHGLELDQRCTQIAAFNLALAAWKLAGSPIDLPPLNIACSGLAPNASKEEWLELAEDAAAAGGMPVGRDLYGVDETLMSSRLKGDLAALYDHFEQAPVLGSLIDPRGMTGALFENSFSWLQPLLSAALGSEKGSEAQAERVVAAQGMARAAELLAGDYTLAITNVPYLGRGQQDDELKSFADDHYKTSKADLATIFVERMMGWLGASGTAAAVTPQNWLFLTTYKKLREKLLRRRTWNLVVRLGEHAFQSSSAAGAFAAMVTISEDPPSESEEMAGFDVSAPRGQTPIYVSEKATLLRGGSLPDYDGSADGVVGVVSQIGQFQNPDARITLEEASKTDRLEEYVICRLGLGTGDSPHYLRRFWEMKGPGGKWALYQTASSDSEKPNGFSSLVAWDPQENRVFGLSDEERVQAHNQDYRGREAWNRRGVLVGVMSQLLATPYWGALFDKSAAAIVPYSEEHLPAILAYVSSPEFSNEVRKLDQKLMVTNATLIKVPFDCEYWKRVAGKELSSGFPEPESNDPTQWLFHGHPANAEPATVFQVAISRLLGYRWPPEHDPEMRLAAEARNWVDRCEALLSFADEDGIVCLSPLRGERSAADRLRALLAAAYGNEWSAAKERELLDVAGDGKKPTASLEDWLRDRFFSGHCKLFRHRPFVWHIWDGRKDGFHCLVNAHHLTGPDGEGRRTLEALTYSYLGDWIVRQRAEQRDGREGADGRLAAALDLQGQLERILEGEPPYDLFVRWKPLHEQAIGWEPDINDGIRLNIRPFMSAELRKGGRKGAGILRWKPNIKWGPKPDRGKEPQSLRPKADFPWFWSCPGDGTFEERTDFQGGDTFDGRRWNDLHYSNAVKRMARERKERERGS